MVERSNKHVVQEVVGLERRNKRVRTRERLGCERSDRKKKRWTERWYS